MAYIFGGNTNLSYEDIQRKRRVADALLSSMGAPRDVGEGLSAIGKALAIRGINKQTDKADASNREAFNQKWAGLFSAPSQASFAPPPVDPNSPEGIGDATMVALGKAPDYSGLEGKYGLPAGYLARTAQLESGGNPNAQNPNSSAGGAFQFIDSTAAQYGLTDKMDPVASADAAARLARDNKAYLKNALGREPTAAELYLAHQQGAGGAAKLLLSGSAPAETAVSRDAISLNGGAPGMTAQDFASHWTSKFDGGPQPANMSVAQLAEIAGDPYASPGQKALVSALLQQQMQGMDPAYQLDLQLKQAQLENAQGGDGTPEMVQQRQMLAQLAGLEPGTPEYQQFMLTGNTVGRGANEYGLNPVMGRDENGNIVVMQLGKDGTAIASQLPEGVTPDLAIKAEENARGATIGKESGAASVDLSGARVVADRTMRLVDDLANDPKLGSMLGPIDSLKPNITADSKRVQAKMDQLKGVAFLEAYNMLRGGGQITEAEGAKAQDAMIRMQSAQNEKDYRAALMDFKDAVGTGIAKLEARSKATTAPQLTTPDDLSEDELKYLGGN